MVKQIISIGGGDTFDTYNKYLRFLRKWEIDFAQYKDPKKSWRKNLGKDLGEGYEVIDIDMPNKLNAKYPEWKIWFEKFVPHLAGELILVGHSLGGTFLVKYLSENNFSKNIKGVFLVAPAYDGDTPGAGETFSLPRKLKMQTDSVIIYHSMDDSVVPISELNKFSGALPNAVVKQFTDRGHFNQESFPELVDDIINLK